MHLKLRPCISTGIFQVVFKIAIIGVSCLEHAGKLGVKGFKSREFLYAIHFFLFFFSFFNNFFLMVLQLIKQIVNEDPLKVKYAFIM